MHSVRTHLPSSWKIYIRLNLNITPTHPFTRVPSGRFPASSRKTSQLFSLTYQHIALRTVLLWIITQRVEIISCPRFGTIYRSHKKRHTEQESLESDIRKRVESLKYMYQLPYLTNFLLSERREYKLKLWRMRIIHTSSHPPVSEFTPFIIREDLCEMKINKAIPLQTWRGPEGSRSLRLPDFKTIDTGRW